MLSKAPIIFPNLWICSRTKQNIEYLLALLAILSMSSPAFIPDIRSFRQRRRRALKIFVERVSSLIAAIDSLWVKASVDATRLIKICTIRSSINRSHISCSRSWSTLPSSVLCPLWTSLEIISTLTSPGGGASSTPAFFPMNILAQASAKKVETLLLPLYPRNPQRHTPMREGSIGELFSEQLLYSWIVGFKVHIAALMLYIFESQRRVWRFYPLQRTLCFRSYEAHTNILSGSICRLILCCWLGVVGQDPGTEVRREGGIKLEWGVFWVQRLTQKVLICAKRFKVPRLSAL